MNLNLVIKKACHNFAAVAAPFLYIEDESHYQETLFVIEELMEEAKDSLTDPLNAVIDMLSNAIEKYESEDLEINSFVDDLDNQSVDVALIRLLLDQHSLGMGDLPEIGSKSMVSRVLSGERKLNKNHIQALSARFHISPALFFESS
ncbi:MAG: transcriptional regulator [Cellvibrionales bacterium]|nr:MAG: transcriptional regulator [Cellvibrionales bacterium]